MPCFAIGMIGQRPDLSRLYKLRKKASILSFRAKRRISLWVFSMPCENPLRLRLLRMTVHVNLFETSPAPPSETS